MEESACAEDVMEEISDTAEMYQEQNCENADRKSFLPPAELTVSDISTDCMTLSWEPPAGEVTHYIVSCSGGEEVVQELQTEGLGVTIRDLRPGQMYHFAVSAHLKNGVKSDPTATSAGTKPLPPSGLTVRDISTDCMTLSWEPPAGEVQYYTVSCSSGEEVAEELQTEETSLIIRELKPGQMYHLSVSVQLKNGLKSDSTATSAGTTFLPPAELTVSDISTNSVSLSWEPPAGEVTHYTVSCSSREEVVQELQTEGHSVTIRDLRPGQMYHFAVSAHLKNRVKSDPTATSAGPKPLPPAELTVSDISTDCMTLSWEPPAGEVQYYTVCCSSGEEVAEELQTEETSLIIRELMPGQMYHLSVSVQLKNGLKSDSTVTSAATSTQVELVLDSLGLLEHYKNKLSLERLLQIDSSAIAETPPESNKDVLWFFIKKVMLVNVTARNIKCESCSENENDDSTLDLDALVNRSVSEDTLSLHDIITALFLCSDGFVQQELSLKLSMCQFAVPLLLPNCDTNQCTLMLWALRDIVKKYRPQSLSETKGFKEEAIVQSEIPLISFVRLGDCSLSKSEILNKLLSNSQQYHDTFVHRDMEGGDCPRTISNGLAEMTWYLPCGKKNIDIFDEPVAIANLRGDIASLETQYAFLCHASSAVFVFLDCLDSRNKPLITTKGKAQMFLVADQQNKNFCLNDLKEVAGQLQLKNNNILLKTKKMNDSDFVKNVQKTMRSVIKDTNTRLSLELMASIARDLGICVDEDHPECQNARQKADAITARIKDIPSFKKEKLPRQGETWKTLTSLEKEEIRLKNVGSQNIEKYKARIRDERKELRKKQNSCAVSEAMASFISSISGQSIERLYFLKWMRINLDNLSRKKLSGLRQEYKKKSKILDNKEELKKIDVQLSDSSLGTENFIREMSQIYEASVSLPDTEPSRKQLQRLSRLCAQLLLDGFPLELVDGDASNIPLRWVSDVLAQLHELVSPNNKILVVTVLGVQSTGKSTLLNTMFGVQFAVSSGRCTRGAFMLLIKISEDMKTNLDCDFLVIIDTEGLKSPELATLENSYEHDNELATLVVGLSDITIINIAMQNSTEMKDILQIVVHAFLRMKEVGKKPKCQFVHQNVADVSADEKNLRDRKLLLQQLNEMTQAAAKMEKKEENKSFTDVMDYDPDTGNWYIPGLWNGNPPMAPVNTGYSEAVYELKKNVIQLLEKCDTSARTVSEFSEWIKSLWTAVKHENFIFSFRNSLVADAYMRLCMEYNKWEWEFKKDMYTWSTNAETQIKNFGIGKEQSNVDTLVNDLKIDMIKKLSGNESTLLNNLKTYFQQKEGHVYLVESYRTQFENSAKMLRKQLENSATNQIIAAADIKRGMTDVERIKKDHTKQIDECVSELINNCRQKKAEMTDHELDREFDKMWKTIMNELKFTKQTPGDIFNMVELCLRQNLQDKSGHANELLNQKPLKQCGRGPYEYSAEGLQRAFKERLYKFFWIKDIKRHLQSLADKIIGECDTYIERKAAEQNNYHHTYIEELLHIIDNHLKNEKHVNTEFEVSLKQHICATGARRFQKMHEDFLHCNDPRRCLMENRHKFCKDFKDAFKRKDLCQKKAEEFTKQCLTPAVEDYVKRFLGSDIVAEMQTFDELKERMSFQRTVLGELLQKDSFSEYLKYTTRYESYVKGLIRGRILNHFSDPSRVSKFEEEHVNMCLRLIKDAIKKAEEKESQNIKEFVYNICSGLDNKLVIEQNALNSLLFLNITDKKTFVHWLTQSVDEMGQSLKYKLSKSRIEMKLKHLTVNPLDELYKKLIGCGKQCPFCNVPCEAGASEHTEHFASLHRPQAFTAYRHDDSDQLVTNICSSCINSDIQFINSDTKDECHPYKDYRDIYPDWKIMPDSSYEASDCWKYVLVKFNSEFAEEYEAKPADIPESWKSITKIQAIDSVQKMYCC